MGDVVAGAAQEVWSILVAAITDPGPWLIAAGVLCLAVLAALMRGKLTSPWVWIPALGAAGVWAFRHLPR